MSPRPGGSKPVDIDPELHAQLEQAAKERGVSIVWIVNKLLREILPDLKPADEFSLVRRDDVSPRVRH